MSEKDLSQREVEIEALVKSVQNGDQEAFAKIYDVFIDPIYRYVYYRVNSAEAEDLIETVFLKAWENIKQYKHDKKSFAAWLFRIAHNLVVDHYRSSKDKVYEELNAQLPDLNRQHNPIKSTQNILDNQMLKEAIGSIKREYREIIIHKFVNELSNKEIAEVLNKSEGSLRILQFRALKALRNVLEEKGVNY
ncbi:MAG: sigma-70 family RNA polymerase sigma factor [Patescibacteria group bacterium]